MVVGSGFPDAFVPAQCMQNAALTKNEKTLVSAISGNALAFPQASAQMPRMFGPCGYASRRDLLVAQDMDTVSEEEDCEAWMAYRKARQAKTGGGDQGNRDNRAKTESGRTENPISRRTGRRNRCYTCNSEYHCAPQCPQKENRYSGAFPPLKTSEKIVEQTLLLNCHGNSSCSRKSAEVGLCWAGSFAGALLLHNRGSGGPILGAPVGMCGDLGNRGDGELGLLQIDE